MAEIVDYLKAYGLEEIYSIEKIVGEGSFGIVFRCGQKKKDSTEKIALKVFTEKKYNKSTLLEYDIMSRLQGIPGIPRVFGYHEFGSYKAISMELLGSNLADLQAGLGTFSYRTAYRVTIQVLDILEAIHNLGYLHRDLKPANILIGAGHKSDTIYLVDYGVSKKFLDMKLLSKGGHLNNKNRKGLIGTARFASLHSHQNMELSRRDDLESLLYIMIYMVQGNLVWSQIDFRHCKGKYEVFELIKNAKAHTPLEDICKGFPPQVASMLQYVRSLNFKEQPAYFYLRKILYDLLESVSELDRFDNQTTFEWEARKSSDSQTLIKPLDLKKLQNYQPQSSINEYGLPYEKPLSSSRKTYCRVNTNPVGSALANFSARLYSISRAQINQNLTERLSLPTEALNSINNGTNRTTRTIPNFINFTQSQPNLPPFQRPLQTSSPRDNQWDRLKPAEKPEKCQKIAEKCAEKQEKPSLFSENSTVPPQRSFRQSGGPLMTSSYVDLSKISNKREFLVKIANKYKKKAKSLRKEVFLNSDCPIGIADRYQNSRVSFSKENMPRSCSFKNKFRHS